MSYSADSKRTSKNRWRVILSIAAMSCGLSVATKSCIAQVPPPSIDTSLNEEIIMVPVQTSAMKKPSRASKSSGADIADINRTLTPSATISQGWIGELETTIFKPSGNGPFPLLVLNHGKALGNTHAQERARFLSISREFVKRGYAVIVPMRTGFSRSSGDYIEQHCNMTVNGQIQARDLQNVLDYVTQQPWADRDRILIGGQSYGGLTALAFATYHYPGVRGIINFAGGLRTEGGCQWQDSLTQAFTNYGAQSTVPSIWFYGANDSYFGPELASRLYEAYTHAGGNATLIAYGAFKNDAHAMSGSRDGVKIWWPETEKFLQQIGMPTAVTFTVNEPPAPTKTNFANLDDADAVPYLHDRGRSQYQVFLTKSQPRAFALSPSGAWSWAEDGDDPNERALANCQKNSDLPCKLYAVDDYVVWDGNS